LRTSTRGEIERGREGGRKREIEKERKRKRDGEGEREKQRQRFISLFYLNTTT
jgi:hypothetical protein